MRRRYFLGAAQAAWLTFGGLAGQAHAEAPTSQVTEVVVTAEKREQSLQDVPASISALNAEAIAQRGIDSFEDLQFQTPSLQFGSSFGISNISIRGVGLEEFSGVTDPAVAIYVDGLYLPRPSLGDITQSDISRIEVLRGPQGTLYGRNSDGGVVNFIANAPTARREGSLSSSYASFDEFRLSTTLNAPLGDSVRARLAVNYMNRGQGFIENITPGLPSEARGDTRSARATVDIALSPAAKVELSAFGATDTISPSISPRGAIPAEAIALNPFLATAAFSERAWTTGSGIPDSSHRDYGSLRATLDWDLGVAKFKSITGYQHTSWHLIQTEGTSAPAAIFDRRDRSSTVSQEVNLSGETKSLSWVVGAFYIHDNYRLISTFAFPHGLNSDAGVNITPQALEVTNLTPDLLNGSAVFADITAKLTDRLSVFGGVRYSEDQRRYDQTSTVGPVEILFPIPGVPGTPGILPLLPSCIDQITRQRFSSVTPRGGLRYDLAEGQNAYVAVSQGYKSGGVNPGACGPGVPNTFEPETIVAYEAGYKARLDDGRLTLAVSVFDYEYKNLQITQILFTDPTIFNAPARIKGAEMEAAWLPDAHWTLDGSVTLLDSRYGHFESQDPVAAGIDPFTPTVDLRGRRLNNSPPWAGNLGLQYKSDEIARFGTLTARAQIHASDKYYFQPFNSPADAQNAYGLVDLFLIWDSVGGRYRGRLFATNLGNVAVIESMGVDSPLAQRYVTWNRPRQVGFELSTHF